MFGKQNIQKISLLLLYAIFFMGLLPFLVLSFYNHPSADDYLWTMMVLKTNLWQFQVYNFYEWSGRYFSNILVGLNPLVFHSFLGYQLASLFSILAFFLVVFLLIKELTKGVFLFSQQLLGALIFVVLFLAYTPSVVELFYWFTGTYVYTTANILFFLFIYCLLKLMNAYVTDAKLARLKMSMTALTVLMMWSNEIIIVCLGGMLFLLASLTTYHKHPSAKFFMFLMGIAIISALASLLAPGNAARAAVMFPNKFNISFTLHATLSKFLETLYWIKNVPLWLISLLFLPVCIKLSRESSLFSNHFYIHPILSVGLWLAILCLAYFPIYLATGLESIAMRVKSTNYLFFIVGWFFNIQVCVGFLLKKYGAAEKVQFLRQPLPFYLVLPILLIFCYKFFSTNSNVGEAWADLSGGVAKTYDTKMKERYKLLNEKNTVIPYIIEQPTTLFFVELDENPIDWKNKNFADYFGVDSVKVIK